MRGGLPTVSSLWLWGFAVVSAVLLVACGEQRVSPSPTAAADLLPPLAVVTTESRPTVVPTPTADPSPTPTATPAPSATPVPTDTPTPVPTDTPTPVPTATPDYFYTGDWEPNFITPTNVGTVLIGYRPGVDGENWALLAVSCVNPPDGDSYIDVTLYTLGYKSDPTAIDLKMAWDDAPTESVTWGESEVWKGLRTGGDYLDKTGRIVRGLSPQPSVGYGNHLAFIDRLSQHDHLRIDLESPQGWRQASFNLAGFLGAYQPAKRECYLESIPSNVPASPTEWTRFNFNKILAHRLDRPSYSPSPQGAYVETRDEDTGEVYQFHINCTNPGYAYVWSRIKMVVPNPDEDTLKTLSAGLGELSLGVEIDGRVVSSHDWNGNWSLRSYFAPGGRVTGGAAIIHLEDVEDSYGLLEEMYNRDAKEVVFTLSGERYNVRMPFDVRGFQEALQPMLDHCDLSPGD